MLHSLENLWYSLSPLYQDLLFTLVLLLPTLVLGLYLTRSFSLRPLVQSLMLRYRWTNLVLILLIAVSVGLGVGLITQERGLRKGTAQATDKFDLVISAPGSEITMLLASVFLQPSDVALLDGETFNRIANDNRVDLAAPLAFGDSYNGAPIVGTITAFLEHLAGPLESGRLFEHEQEAVVGALVPLKTGEHFTPAHGFEDGAHDDHDHGSHGHGDHNDHAEEDEAGETDNIHHGFDYEVVGRMKPTGTPWDQAILVPVEGVWAVHGLSNGHAPSDRDRLGPPYHPEYFPGTPAIIVKSQQLWANYALRSDFTTAESMAFFPGEVLTRLYSVMGDIRQAMSLMAVITEVLVTAGVLTGLVMLTRLLGRRFALLKALGAPDRFVFALVWCYATTLILTGALTGFGLGYLTSKGLSALITEHTSILIDVAPGWAEVHLVAAFTSLTATLALLPAWLTIRRPALEDLRQN
ncbi:ABC transporter permease [Kiloniella sp. b19]|uniref:ABC transporter permease n=1 Tax=Kiloniella sp. GXU_MW_B19 TaxID=3141326 RepID=UPI0031E35BBB